MNLVFIRKLTLSLVGIGGLAMLASAGTYATFTATTTNPNNTFSAGTLKLTDTTSAVGFSTANGSAPNATGGDPRTAAECSNAVVGSACTTTLRSVNVAANGMEPGPIFSR